MKNKNYAQHEVINQKKIKYEKVLVNLNKSLELEPNDVSSIRNRGLAYSMIGNYKESIADLTKSLEFEPNNTLALRKRGKGYHNMGRH